MPVPLANIGAWSETRLTRFVEDWFRNHDLPATKALQADVLRLGTRTIASLVSSFNGRDGDVLPQSGDYTAAQVTNAADKSSGSVQSFTGGIASIHSGQGVGYATGAGASVTQLTSKTTGVTVNSVTGAITMNAAALAAGATVVFAVNNTTVGTADGVLLTPARGFGTSDTYQVQCDLFSTGGGFRIAVKNISAGSLSEALVINFAVIKGATA